MKTCWFVVIQANGAWWVDCEGRAYGPFSAKDQALEHAREIAVAFGDPARRSDVWAPGTDGKFELVWSGPPPASRGRVAPLDGPALDVPAAAEPGASSSRSR